MLRDEQEDDFTESMIREGTEEISAQQHEEANSYLNIENAEADSDGEDNAHPSNEKNIGQYPGIDIIHSFHSQPLPLQRYGFLNNTILYS